MKEYENTGVLKTAILRADMTDKTVRKCLKADVLRACGPGAFLQNPILEPTQAYFPDSWAPNIEGVRILTERLLRYAGLQDLEPEVSVYTDLAWEEAKRTGEYHTGAAALFIGIQDNKVLIACAAHTVLVPEVMVSNLGHEVAHAYRAHNKIKGDSRAREETLTDLTTIALGFGLFTCIASRVSSNRQRVTLTR